MLKSESSYEDETFKALDVKNIKKSLLENITFESCIFIQSNWQQATLNNCHFKNCNLSLIDLKGCRLQDTVFEECKIVGLDFYKCDKMLHPTFLKCVLQTCNFSDVKLKGTSFTSSKLREVHFTNTDLSETNCELLAPKEARMRAYSVQQLHPL